VYFGLIDGENATLSLLLYVLIYRAIARNHGWLAGCCAAVGLFKPQLFFLFPLIFLAQRNWRAIGAYVVTAFGLAVVSIAVVGVAGIEAWTRIIIEPEAGNALGNAWRMASLKSFFDVLLPGTPAVALGIYGVASLAMVAGVVALWSTGQGSLQVRWIVTCLVAVLINPHLVDYDLTVLVPAGIMAATILPVTRVWMALLYPLLVIRVTLPLGDSALQLTPLILGIILATVWLQFRPRSAEANTVRIGLEHAAT
jgi:Glycosyltransferase family 87